MPARASRDLSDDAVHVWRLPYRRGEGRAPLRRLLAAYLDTTSDRVQFHDGEHGRPVLRDAPTALDFNWSHSGDIALVAIARGLPQLGIDIEVSRPRPRALALAERFFAIDEHTRIAALPDTQRTDAFLRLWTAKEAVLKGLGEGLRYGLHRVAFRLVEGEPVAHAFDGPVGPPGAWQLHPLARPDFTACLAWRGAPRRVHWLHMTES
ncbi:hypothetical protein LF63_0100490 [Oleiagrimonas soli]|uniref:4'-phosphopantetheinyl transferase domain-containing protein n=1 Tax=Oleiagrimonas soli TaxID=1543381 RepID=A0A099CZJ1_9GAMM|nr:4'-phosphopantetheinyl transferase superfamily protein [Oleiagrimonas soli]KGI79204.1 hypothetical protein LF63_0100490 [Oleiagrimonas soli]